MALDELIFGKIAKFFRNKPAAANVLERTAMLETLKPRLTVLARALTGNAIDIFPAIKEGGYKSDSFFLPEKMAHYPAKELNEAFYFFRIFYLSTQQNEALNWFSAEALPDEKALLLSIENKDKILAFLFHEFPLMHDIFDALVTVKNPESQKVIETSWLCGRFMTDKKITERINKNMPDTNKIKAANASTPKTTIKSKPVEEIISVMVNQKQQEDYVLTHNFEKVETADEFNGVWRNFDGEDDLEEHQDALNDLNLKYTVRVDDSAHSVYEASFTDNTSVAESADSGEETECIHYDEWDCHKKNYKRAFSKVFLSQYKEQTPAYYTDTIAKNKSVLLQLRKMLTSINNKWQQQKLQLQGKEIDIDMAVNRFADIHSGHTPSDKIYISDRKAEKDISILLLLDVSLSSDSYAAGNRVIDVEKQTAILFGEILNEYNIDFSVNCFFSKTRNFCSYQTIKEFDEPWQTARFKTGTPQPSGYTRIGPALRHSGTLLRQRTAKNKWIILVSDGKPNDYDRYEGRYGIQDVKQALRELNGESINSFAIAIEANAKYYLPQMFGQNHYQIVSSPVELLTSLIKLYERIKYNT